MSVKYRLTLISVAVVALTLAVLIHSVTGRAQGPAPGIHLKAVQFVPGLGQAPPIPPASGSRSTPRTSAAITSFNSTALSSSPGRTN